MPDEFIKPKEAIEILKVCRTTLLRNHLHMKIRRTIQKPYLYHRGDCVRWRFDRTQCVDVTKDPDLEKVLQRIRNQHAKRQIKAKE